MRKGFAIGILLLTTASAFAFMSRGGLTINAGLRSIFGAKRPVPPEWAMHKQSVSIENQHFKAAEQRCANWSWVAGIANIAAASGVRIDQQYMIDRLYGGSVCLSSAGDPDNLAQRISHDYVLADGQKFQLAAHFTPGAPTDPDPLIAALRQDRPLMLFWKHRSYLLTGMDFDEYIAPTGNKMFIVTGLKLFDPAGEAGKRDLTFSRDQDDPADLDGILELSIQSK